MIHADVEVREFYTYVRVGKTAVMIGDVQNEHCDVREVLTLIDYTDENCPVRTTFDPNGSGVNFEELFHAIQILHAEHSAKTPGTARDYVAERQLGGGRRA